MVHELTADPDSHGIITARITDNPRAFMLALEAVNAGLGHQGYQLAWKRIGPNGGIVQNRIWLDTGLTPEERAAAVAAD